LVFGRKDGEEGDDVWMGQFLEKFEFADSIGGETFCVFFLDFDFFDGDEFGRVGFEVAEIYVGIGSFTELFAWEKLE
jgi:hypothetical protein